ncbi:hypothetical protein AAFF_G00345040 [Aldrovandia affinis]|uniref:Uncharacterized protein n=1 Tax=Aldrovandia affinis TaxID=143900 RepID=A0AAD7VZT3_9TELE|nr:hypothetical protein AAFF_G00345040 [Aldrovandia affinis]
MTTMKSVVTTGESVTARRDGNRAERASNPICILREEEPNQATMNLMEKYPRGAREGEDEHPSRTDTTLTDPGNGQTTMSKQCTCGKVCKNIHGLKIHRARMKCPLGAEATQRTGVTPGETQEVPGPESPHSAQNLKCCKLTPRASSLTGGGSNGLQLA